MESNFDWEKVNLPEIVESLSAIIFSPMIVPVAEVIKHTEDSKSININKN